MSKLWILPGAGLVLLLVASGGCSSSGTSTGSGGSGGSGGSVNCNCPKGAYFPVCGVDGKTYDATCGLECVPVAIACNTPCPCTDAGGPTTTCDTTICTHSEVCVTPGCGGYAPDGGGGTCSEPSSCQPLPSGCGPVPTCDCLGPLWTPISCGTLTYGTLQCMKPCA